MAVSIYMGAYSGFLSRNPLEGMLETKATQEAPLSPTLQ